MKEAIIVIGLGFGDEGKGSIVDYLTRIKNANVVVRFNGGAQAGHNVVTPDLRHHTFSQFGSGTFAPGVKTHLSRFMVMNLLGLLKEEEHLQSIGIKDAFQRLTVDEDALITTPFQMAVNRLMETWRGGERHGSCGLGIGQAIKDRLEYGDRVLFAKDLKNFAAMEKKLAFLRDVSFDAVREKLPRLPRTDTIENELAWLRDADAVKDLAKYFYYIGTLLTVVSENYLRSLLEDSVAIFEGAQGILLDRNYGFYPYVTKTDTTFANAYQLLNEAGYQDSITKIGVLRGYATRHGAGPFVTEDRFLNPEHFRDWFNQENEWQGKLRFGWLDIPALRYSLSVSGGVDYLALTHLDQLSGSHRVKSCVSYAYSGKANLDSYFGWELIEKEKAKITALLEPPPFTQNGERAQILFHCAPHDFREFKDKQEYIEFLQSKEGLNAQIKILSSGPTGHDKEMAN